MRAPLDLTRRQFATGAAAAAATLTVLGCGGETSSSSSGGDKRDTDAHLADAPFLAGSIEQYRSPGVYDNFKTHDPKAPGNKGVWLVSDGRTLIAFAARCTHRGCTTDWDADKQHFVCPCHGSEFDTAGMEQPNSKAKHPLERFAITIADSSTGPQVRVDPTRLLKKDDGQWDEPDASLSLT